MGEIDQKLKIIRGEITKAEYPEMRDWANSPVAGSPGIPPLTDEQLQKYGGGSEDRIGKATGRSYRKMFPDVEPTNGGFDSFREFARNVSLGLVDDRLKRFLEEGTGSSGGFVVPTEYSQQIFDVALESEIIRPRATIYPMKSDERRVPGTVIGDHSSSLYGGVIAYWRGEGQSLTTSEPTFREINLKPKKLTVYGKASNEWVEDGIGNDTVMGIYSGALGWNLDKEFFNGDGSGKPLGILNSACTIEVSAESGQSAATIEYKNLTNMFSRMHPACLKNSVWVAHSTCIPQLLELSIAIGTGGAHVPVMTESNGQFKILTRPVIFTEKAQTLGTKGDIMLCDFSQYIIGLRSDIRLDTSQHVAFNTDELYYRGIVRVDGQPGWNEALTLQDGSTTVSPFVVLEDR